MILARSIVVAAAMAAVTLAAAAAATLSSSDRSFVEQAMTGNSSEIRQGQIFGDSSDPLVASFAKRMVQDHGEANTQLIALANSDGIHVSSGQLPVFPAPAATQNTDLSPQQKAKAMAGLPPVEFFTQAVHVHQQAIALYKHEIVTGANSQVVSYARHTLLVIESHLALAQKDLQQEKAQHHG
jgi:putative membrane protein